WYRVATENGNEFILVDPARGTRGPAFDQAKLAAALSAASGAKYEAFNLPFQQIDFSADGKSMSLFVERRDWTCDNKGNQCSPAPDGAGNRAEGQRGGQRGGGGFGANAMATSPDGKRIAFVRDYTLWIRDSATGKETQLTTDGVKDFGYLTNNAGWTKSDSPVLAWAPDSKKIATFRHDGRGVGEMYLVDTRTGHPHLQAWKYPLPGDEKIFMIERVIINVDGNENAARVIRLKIPPDPHRSSLCDHIVCGGVWADVQWSADSAQLAFVSTSRDHKEEKLRVADAATGTVRDVLEEKVATFFESGIGRVNWRFLPASNEVIWFSERDNWG